MLFHITTAEQGTHQVGSFYTAEHIIGQAVLMAAIPRLPWNSGKESARAFRQRCCGSHPFLVPVRTDI